MKNSPTLTSCDPVMLNRYFDQELGPDESEQIGEHLKTCPSCQKALRDNQVISTYFREGLNEELSLADFEALEKRVLNRVQSRQALWWNKISDLFVLKKIYVPATAVAAALVLFFTVLYYPAAPNGPSAIITSLSGQISSVMIFETPKAHQTVLWYNEDLPLNGEDDAV